MGAAPSLVLRLWEEVSSQHDAIQLQFGFVTPGRWVHRRVPVSASEILKCRVSSMDSFGRSIDLVHVDSSKATQIKKKFG